MEILNCSNKLFAYSPRRTDIMFYMTLILCMSFTAGYDKWNHGICLVIDRLKDLCLIVFYTSGRQYTLVLYMNERQAYIHTYTENSGQTVQDKLIRYFSV